MISQTEIVQLVHRILDGADLSQVTGKIVRAKVLDALGERVGNDDLGPLKKAIRFAIGKFLANESPTQAQENKDDSSDRGHRHGKIGVLLSDDSPDEGGGNNPVGKFTNEKDKGDAPTTKVAVEKKDGGDVSVAHPASENRNLENPGDQVADEKVTGETLEGKDTSEKEKLDTPDNKGAQESNKGATLVSKYSAEETKADLPAAGDVDERDKEEVLARKDADEKEKKESISANECINQNREQNENVDAELENNAKRDDDDADFIPIDGKDMVHEPEIQPSPEQSSEEYESDDDGDSEKMDESWDHSERRVRTKGKKKRLKLLAEDDNDCNMQADSHALSNGTGKTQAAIDKKRGGGDAVEPGAEVKSVKRKRSNSSGLKTEKHLEKLRSVCRQLGCPAPPMRLRNKSVLEKCAAILEHLEDKGVQVANPASLTAREIQRHRARLERDKELAGLDTRFVCLPSSVYEFTVQQRKGYLVDLHSNLLAFYVRSKVFTMSYQWTSTDTTHLTRFLLLSQQYFTGWTEFATSARY